MKKKVKINFIPVEGDVLAAIANAVHFNVDAALKKNGYALTKDLKEIIRDHSKL